MGQNRAILVHYTKPHRYVLYTEEFLPSGHSVSMVSDFNYNSQVPEEEVHRRARKYSLDRAKSLGVELVEKVEEDER